MGKGIPGSGYMTAEEQDMMVEHLRSGKNVATSAKCCKLGTHRLYDTVNKFPEFRERYEQAKKDGNMARCEQAEAALIDGLTTMWTETKESYRFIWDKVKQKPKLDADGNPVLFLREKSVRTLPEPYYKNLILFLSRMMPQKYAPRLLGANDLETERMPANNLQAFLISKIEQQMKNATPVETVETLAIENGNEPTISQEAS